MKTRRRSFLRLPLTAITALTVVLSFSGCVLDLSAVFGFLTERLLLRQPVTVDPLELTLSADEAAVGTVDLPIVIQLSPDVAEPTGSSIESEDGTAPDGVALNVLPDGLSQGSIRATLSIAATAPRRPILIRVSARRSIESPGGVSFPFIYAGSALFHVRAAGAAAAPRVTGISPASAHRGDATPVTISGIHFDATTLLTAEPGVTIEDPLLDAAAGTITATLRLPPDLPVGPTYLRVQTAAGESARIALNVTQYLPPPLLTGLFPDYAQVGSREPVALVGQRFRPGTLLAAPGLELLGTPSLTSPFVATQLVNAAGEQRTESVRALTHGGFSQAVPFRIEPRGFRGPRLRGVRPDLLVAGARNQVLLELENTGDSYGQQSVELVGVPTERLAQPFTATQVLAAPAASRFVAAVVDVSEVGSVLSTHLGARTGGNLGGTRRHTNLVPIHIAPVQGDTPMLRRAQIGRVAPGETVTDTILGRNLNLVTALRFNVPTLTAQIVSIAPDGLSLTASITAAADVPLTGGTLTVLSGSYPRSRTGTNAISYLVEPPGGGGGGVPQLDVVAPNWAYRGGNVDFLVNGAGFTAPVSVFIRPAEGAQIATPNLQDTRNLIVASSFPATSNLVAYFLSATTAGGTSAEVNIPVLDNPDFFRGPELNPAIFPPGSASIIPDTPAQVGIPGQFLVDDGGPTTLVTLPLADEAVMVQASRFFPAPTPGGELGGVLEITASLAPGTSLYGSRFALRRSDGLISAPFVLQVARAGQQVPIVRTITPKSLPGGQTTLVTLTGERLTGVNAFNFSVEGVTAANITPSADGSSVTAEITVALDAPFTGDARTVFQVSADPGNPSNETSFIIPVP